MGSAIASGISQFLLTDQVGSLRAVADTSGNIVKRIDYDSFGNIIADTNPSFSVPFGFAGGLHDRDTGLVRFGYRDYSPELGRFTAKDPIDFAGGDTNLYAYVMNDPINFTDPLGLELVPVNLPGLGPTYLDDTLVPAVNRFISEARQNGLEPVFNSAYRTPEQQEALHQNPDAVTPANQSLHSCGFAVDVNYSSLPNDAQRTILREAARAAGLDWGGNFRNPDPPHFYTDPGGDRAERIRQAAERYRQLTQ